MKETWKEKLLRLAIIITPVSWFIIFTTFAFKDRLDIATYSPFGGWQLGSNALFMYAHVPPNMTGATPEYFKVIHGITVRHMDSLNRLKQRPDRELGIYYLWDEKAPLKLYLAQKYRKDSITHYLKRWVSVSNFYGEYGAWLIKQHPVEFLRYYIWPNLLNYYSPPTEFLGFYNMARDTVDTGAVQWFGYKSNKVYHFSKNKLIVLTAIFPLLLAIINVIFFFSFIGFIILGGFSKVRAYCKNVLWIVVLVWFSNLVFSVLASPIVLRYQAFPFIFTLVFGTLMLSLVIKESRRESKSTAEDVDPAIQEAL